MNTTADRFWSKVRGGDVTQCWTWTAAVDPLGYGRFAVSKRDIQLAHRIAYCWLRTDIPPGLVLDHLCRNTSCVNPWHLEPVSHAENIRRGRHRNQNFGRTHCDRGHPYTPDNTAMKSGARVCIKCRRAHDRARRARLKLATASTAA